MLNLRFLFVLVCAVCVQGVFATSSSEQANDAHLYDLHENPYTSDAHLYRDISSGYPAVGSELDSQEKPVDVPLSTQLTRDFLDFPSDAGLGALWKSTAAMRDRSVHFSQSHRDVFDERNKLDITLFGDLMTSRVPLSDVINANFVTSFVDDSSVLAELSKISFWQEQVGIMLHGFYAYKKVGFSVDLPLSVVIEHPYAPLSTRKALGEVDGNGEGEPLLTEEQKKTFMTQLTKIPWVAGFGDLKLGVRVTDTAGEGSLTWFAGGELILPLQSGGAPQRTLKNSEGQIFDTVTDPFNPSPSDLLFDEAERFKYIMRLLSLLQVVGENPSIGHKSAGVGLVGGIQVHPHPTSTIYATAQAYYQTPVKEYRLIHRYLDVGETQLAVEPAEFLVESRRGVILRGTAGWRQEIAKNWAISLGGDAFFQNKEALFSDVFTGSEKSDRLKNAAQMGQATQVIVFGQLDKKLGWRQGRTHLSLRASGAVDSTGIGKLWNVGLCLSSTF